MLNSNYQERYERPMLVTLSFTWPCRRSRRLARPVNKWDSWASNQALVASMSDSSVSNSDSSACKSGS